MNMPCQNTAALDSYQLKMDALGDESDEHRQEVIKEIASRLIHDIPMTVGAKGREKTLCRVDLMDELMVLPEYEQEETSFWAADAPDKAYLAYCRRWLLVQRVAYDLAELVLEAHPELENLV